ncbi:hypothetical protein MJA45_03095 [Paenibacillus aurantius]|uniref:Uncharacterized protein n=1 Tax=Paenibacillus aurantius TaxID=2918900 RepID=A0AA96LFF8_9BACL|nr:hypothetical protein [Paenibacillus aurantius]WNQ12063.1 hypothetical protein MJA45_03095 [Paenibacillus aurantius]
MENKRLLWRSFCYEHQVFERSVPLFQTSFTNNVDVFPYGANRRLLLKRSDVMESLVRQQSTTVIDDYHNRTDQYDGLIYMMLWKLEGEIIPLYIGKAEKYGKKGGNLSENMKGDSGKFCRWGYNYAYHIGDLSAVVCPDHLPEKRTRKYKKWAEKLFETIQTDSPVLRQQTYFWISPWSKDWTGIWKDYGKTSLTFLEYLLIGVASEIYSDTLLNDEGVNRK